MATNIYMYIYIQANHKQKKMLIAHCTQSREG